MSVRDETFIILTSTPAHNSYIRDSIESFKKLNCGELVLGWDYHEFPHKDIDLPIFLTGQFMGVQSGEAWQIGEGVKAAFERGFKYFFKSAGDVKITLPDNYETIIKVLDKVDFIAERKKGCRDTPYYNFETRSFLGYTEQILRMVTLAHRERIRRIELQYTRACVELGLKFAPFLPIRNNLQQELGLVHMGTPQERNQWVYDQGKGRKD